VDVVFDLRRLAKKENWQNQNQNYPHTPGSCRTQGTSCAASRNLACSTHGAHVDLKPRRHMFSLASSRRGKHWRAPPHYRRSRKTLHHPLAFRKADVLLAVGWVLSKVSRSSKPTTLFVGKHYKVLWMRPPSASSKRWCVGVVSILNVCVIHTVPRNAYVLIASWLAVLRQWTTNIKTRFFTIHRSVLFFQKMFGV
jgi:hypothetical protein